MKADKPRHRDFSRKRWLETVDLVKVRAHTLISGRVQAVFFRSETRNEARKREVTGWVRNLPDGRVEAVFEGDEADVKTLIEFCESGPSGARVASVDVEMENYTGEFKAFEIKY